MNNKIIFKKDLQELGDLTEKLSNIIKPKDIVLLYGEIGVGKTTFTRSLINAFYKKNKKKSPTFIKSPTFPIMISYDLKEYEICHYDFYRIKNIKELDEINFFENYNNNISIIEWPEILIKKLKKYSYYIIKINFINNTTREIEINHSNKKIYL